jgi:hypothetical protein
MMTASGGDASRRAPGRVQVLAPDARRLTLDDIRLLHGGGAANTRGATLASGRQVVALVDGAPAAVATFFIDGPELRVVALAAAPRGLVAVPGLVNALELACLAAGASRVAITVRGDVSQDALAALGYQHAPSRRGWLVKQLA